MSRTFVAAALLLFTAHATAPAQELAWEPSLETALARAKSEGRVLLVAVLVPGERDSDALIACYRDAAVRKLAARCVCLRVDIDHERAGEDRTEVVKRYLGAAPRAPFLAPHHLIVHPDGEQVLSSAARRMTAGQLEWFVADGLRLHDASFEWQPSGRSRAPEGLRYGEVESSTTAPTPTPTDEQVDEAMAALKKGGAGWRGAMEHYQVLLRSDDKAAIRYVESQLTGRAGRFLTGFAIGTISAISPASWSPLLADFLDDRSDDRRELAARGLWAMGDEDARKAVHKRLKAEKTPAVRAWLLRAAAATAPTHRTTVRAIEKAVEDDDDKDVRKHAAVAAGALEDHEVVRDLLSKALNDKDPDVRSAAAYATAARRDPRLIGLLEPLVANEADAETKHWLELALDTLRNRRDLVGFAALRREVLGEQRPGGNGAGGNGPGGNGPGGNGRGGNDPGGGDPGGERRAPSVAR